jgi:small subunit ribosomal protein S20
MRRRDPYTSSLVLRGRKSPVETAQSAEPLKNYLTDGDFYMPNHKSSEKRVRQNEKRRQINRSNRTRLRTSIKNLRAELEGGNPAEMLSATISTIDKAVQKGVLHRNAAARHKSRLTARVNQASAK